MTPLSQDETHDRIESLVPAADSWVVVLAPKGGREQHLALIAGRFFGHDVVRLRPEDPVPLANASERNLSRIVREGLSDGRLTVFVTDDATWDPSSLQGPERHNLVHLAIREFAMPVDRRRARRAIEDEDGITAWAALHYPEEVGDLRRKLLNLMEEIGELVTEVGQDPAEMADMFLRSAARPPSPYPRDDIRGAAGEIGDVGIAVVGVASTLKLNALACRTAKMEVNEAKSPADSQARVARKKAAGLP